MQFNKITFGIVLMLIAINAVYADQCPTPDIIKERKISRAYDWTIDERRTLEDLLAVEELYSVRIKNNGEFAACYYSSPGQLLRLDAKPLKEDCTVAKYEGNWADSSASEQVCNEPDVYQCRFAIYCDETTE